MINIRYAEKKDHTAILKLGENFKLTPYRVDRRFQNLTSVKIPLLINTDNSNSKIITLVAEFRNKIIGFISYTIEKELSTYLLNHMDNAPICGSILFLTVAKEFRNKKIGTLLLNTCLKKCKEQDITILRVSTDYGNHSALSLYQKMGFKIILTWHIYRIYKENNHYSKYLDHIPLIKDPEYSDLFEHCIAKRPIPWLYDPDIDPKYIIKYSKNKIINQIKNNKLTLIEAKIGTQKKVGLSIQQDLNRALHYQLNGTLWTINDMFETTHAGEYLPYLISETISKLPNFLMAEIWLCADDYKLQEILMNAGMHFVYGGIALRRRL